jgi:CBS domain-containing protein
MTYTDENPDLLRPLGSKTLEIGAQIKRAVLEEMALTLEDAVFRRTGLGTLGHPGVTALARAADIMGENPKTISIDSMAVDTLETMESNNISQILVEDNGNYAGVVHLHDLIKEGIF